MMIMMADVNDRSSCSQFQMLPDTTDGKIAQELNMARKNHAKDGCQLPPAEVFRIPKVDKTRNAGTLEHISRTDREALDLMRSVDQTCLFPTTKFRKQWKVTAVRKVRPTRQVEENYRNKRSRMKKQRGTGSSQSQEVLGFFICKDKNQARKIARYGIRTDSAKNTSLGNPCQGVYLYRYLDVALLSQKERKTAYVFVLKVCLGRAKSFPATHSSTATVAEPTPKYDAHVCSKAPQSDEPRSVICSKAQMYVYEYSEEEAVPVQYPRQCLPYALVEFCHGKDQNGRDVNRRIRSQTISTSAGDTDQSAPMFSSEGSSSVERRNLHHSCKDATVSLLGSSLTSSSLYCDDTINPEIGEVGVTENASPDHTEVDDSAATDLPAQRPSPGNRKESHIPDAEIRKKGKNQKPQDISVGLDMELGAASDIKNSKCDNLKVRTSADNEDSTCGFYKQKSGESSEGESHNTVKNVSDSVQPLSPICLNFQDPRFYNVCGPSDFEMNNCQRKEQSSPAGMVCDDPGHGQSKNHLNAHHSGEKAEQTWYKNKQLSKKIGTVKRDPRLDQRLKTVLSAKPSESSDDGANAHSQPHKQDHGCSRPDVMSVINQLLGSKSKLGSQQAEADPADSWGLTWNTSFCESECDRKTESPEVQNHHENLDMTLNLQRQMRESNMEQRSIGRSFEKKNDQSSYVLQNSVPTYQYKALVEGSQMLPSLSLHGSPPPLITQSSAETLKNTEVENISFFQTTVSSASELSEAKHTVSQGCVPSTLSILRSFSQLAVRSVGLSTPVIQTAEKKEMGLYEQQSEQQGVFETFTPDTVGNTVWHPPMASSVPGTGVSDFMDHFQHNLDAPGILNRQSTASAGPFEPTRLPPQQIPSFTVSGSRLSKGTPESVEHTLSGNPFAPRLLSDQQIPGLEDTECRLPNELVRSAEQYSETDNIDQNLPPPPPDMKKNRQDHMHQSILLALQNSDTVEDLQTDHVSQSVLSTSKITTSVEQKDSQNECSPHDTNRGSNSAAVVGGPAFSWQCEDASQEGCLHDPSTSVGTRCYSSELVHTPDGPAITDVAQNGVLPQDIVTESENGVLQQDIVRQIEDGVLQQDSVTHDRVLEQDVVLEDTQLKDDCKNTVGSKSLESPPILFAEASLKLHHETSPHLYLEKECKASCQPIYEFSREATLQREAQTIRNAFIIDCESEVNQEGSGLNKIQRHAETSRGKEESGRSEETETDALQYRTQPAVSQESDYFSDEELKDLANESDKNTMNKNNPADGTHDKKKSKARCIPANGTGDKEKVPCQNFDWSTAGLDDNSSSPLQSGVVGSKPDQHAGYMEECSTGMLGDFQLAKKQIDSCGWVSSACNQLASLKSQSDDDKQTEDIQNEQVSEHTTTVLDCDNNGPAGSFPSESATMQLSADVLSSSGESGALPLSSVGLQHWLEALVDPRLNPDLVLVDMYKAFLGKEDFDNCAICQKVIDSNFLSDDNEKLSETEGATMSSEPAPSDVPSAFSTTQIKLEIEVSDSQSDNKTEIVDRTPIDVSVKDTEDEKRNQPLGTGSEVCKSPKNYHDIVLEMDTDLAGLSPWHVATEPKNGGNIMHQVFSREERHRSSNRMTEQYLRNTFSKDSVKDLCTLSCMEEQSADFILLNHSAKLSIKDQSTGLRTNDQSTELTLNNHQAPELSTKDQCCELRIRNQSTEFSIKEPSTRLCMVDQSIELGIESQSTELSIQDQSEQLSTVVSTENQSEELSIENRSEQLSTVASTENQSEELGIENHSTVVSTENQSAELNIQDQSAELSIQDHSEELSIQDQSEQLSIGNQSTAVSTENQSAELSIQDPSEQLSTENQSTAVSTENQSAELSIQDPSEQLSTENQSTAVSTENRSAELSIQDPSEQLSTENQSTAVSTENRSAELSTQDQSEQLSTENQSTAVSTENWSAELSIQDHFEEFSIENQSTVVSTEDQSADISTKDVSAKLSIKELSSEIGTRDMSTRLSIMDQSTEPCIKDQLAEGSIENQSAKFSVENQSAECTKKDQCVEHSTEDLSLSAEHRVKEQSAECCSEEILSRPIRTPLSHLQKGKDNISVRSLLKQKYKHGQNTGFFNFKRRCRNGKTVGRLRLKGSHCQSSDNPKKSAGLHERNRPVNKEECLNLSETRDAPILEKDIETGCPIPSLAGRARSMRDYRQDNLNQSSALWRDPISYTNTDMYSRMSENYQNASLLTGQSICYQSLSVVSTQVPCGSTPYTPVTVMNNFVPVNYPNSIQNCPVGFSLPSQHSAGYPGQLQSFYQPRDQPEWACQSQSWVSTMGVQSEQVERESSQQQPSKRDMVDWFSDIVGEKRKVTSELQPRSVKKKSNRGMCAGDAYSFIHKHREADSTKQKHGEAIGANTKLESYHSENMYKRKFDSHEDLKRKNPESACSAKKLKESTDFNRDRGTKDVSHDIYDVHQALRTEKFPDKEHMNDQVSRKTKTKHRMSVSKTITRRDYDSRSIYETTATGKKCLSKDYRTGSGKKDSNIQQHACNHSERRLRHQSRKIPGDNKSRITKMNEENFGQKSDRRRRDEWNVASNNKEKIRDVDMGSHHHHVEPSKRSTENPAMIKSKDKTCPHHDRLHCSKCVYGPAELVNKHCFQTVVEESYASGEDSSSDSVPCSVSTVQKNPETFDCSTSYIQESATGEMISSHMDEEHLEENEHHVMQTCVVELVKQTSFGEQDLGSVRLQINPDQRVNTFDQSVEEDRQAVFAQRQGSDQNESSTLTNQTKSDSFSGLWRQKQMETEDRDDNQSLLYSKSDEQIMQSEPVESVEFQTVAASPEGIDYTSNDSSVTDQDQDNETDQAQMMSDCVPSSSNLNDFNEEQIELERAIIRDCLRVAEIRSSSQSACLIQIPSFAKLTCTNGKTLKKALLSVLSECKQALQSFQRRYKGGRHQRLPEELLLTDETNELYTREGNFVIMISGIPEESYSRLMEMKTCLETAMKSGCTDRHAEIVQIHTNRKILMQKYTGSISRKRLNQLQKCFRFYSICQNYLEELLGSENVEKMLFLRASFKALQHHMQLVRREMGMTR